MVEINLSGEIYLYGKAIDKYALSEDNLDDFISIYVAPTVFKQVPLSSLEGIFLVNDSFLERTERISWSVPRLRIKRENMKEYEAKHNGKFVPFDE